MTAKSEFERFGILPNVRLSGSLELHLRCLVRFSRAVFSELKSKTGLPWKQRLRAWKSGFSSNSWMVYNLAENDPKLYLPDLSTRLRSFKINGFFNPIIQDGLVPRREHVKQLNGVMCIVGRVLLILVFYGKQHPHI